MYICMYAHTLSGIQEHDRGIYICAYMAAVQISVHGEKRYHYISDHD